MKKKWFQRHLDDEVRVGDEVVEDENQKLFKLEILIEHQKIFHHLDRN
jgi:hypothetical protein